MWETETREISGQGPAHLRRAYCGKLIRCRTA
jgi:hypothetical protein